ncbi:hypothetical protein ACFX2G_043671 [Malus domestica]
MAPINQILQHFQAMPLAVPAAIAALSLLFLFSVKALIFPNKNAFSKLPSVPVVPGLPVVGNLLQLKEKKPYKTFTRWAEEYGPIYSIRTGATTMVVLNTADVAKEVGFSFSLITLKNGIWELDQLASERSCTFIQVRALLPLS